MKAHITSAKMTNSDEQKHQYQLPHVIGPQLSKLSNTTPNTSSISSKTITNIGKPITRFKAHSYQVYIRITKQGKDKLTNAST
jgi:hypothetical protein